MCGLNLLFCLFDWWLCCINSVAVFYSLGHAAPFTCLNVCCIAGLIWCGFDGACCFNLFCFAVKGVCCIVVILVGLLFVVNASC